MPLEPSRWLPDRGFFRKLMTLSSGTIAGQALVLLSSPLLTRLYDPQQFGVFAVFAAMAGIFAVNASLRYEFAVPVLRENSDAAAAVLLAMLGATASALLLAVVVAVAGERIATGLAIPELAAWLWLLPPAALLWGCGSALSYWSVRRGSYRVNGINRTLQLGTQAGGQVALGLAGAGMPGLLVGYIAGYVVRFGHFSSRLPAADRALLRAVRRDSLRQVARQSWRYPALAMPSSLLQAICDLAPVLLVAMLYGPAMAGWYGLSQRIMAAPVKILSEAASQVFLGEARGLDRRELHRFFLRTLTLFGGLGLLGTLPLLLFAPPLFGLVFGPEWREAGVIVQILVPLYLARFIVFPISQLLYIFNRQDLHFVVSVLNLLALGVSFGAGAVMQLDSRTTLIMFSLASAASFLLYLGISWRLVHVGSRLPSSAA